MNRRHLTTALIAVSVSLSYFSAIPSSPAQGPKLDFTPDFAKLTINDSQVQSVVDAIDKIAQEQINSNVDREFSGAGAAIFTVRPDGKSTSVLVDNFNGDGQGSFGKLLGAAN